MKNECLSFYIVISYIHIYTVYIHSTSSASPTVIGSLQSKYFALLILIYLLLDRAGTCVKLSTGLVMVTGPEQFHDPYTVCSL